MTYMEKPSTLKKKKSYKKTMQIFRIFDKLTKTYFNNQLNAQILLFYNNMYVTLQSSTCFKHLQEDKLYYHSICYRHSLYSTVQYAG